MRVEENNRPTEKEVLRKEIKKELKTSKRKKRLLQCGGCLGVVLIIFGALLFFIGYAGAKSGVFNVPVLSDKFYEEPEPVHQVIVNEEQQENIENILSEKVGGVIESKISPENIGKKVSFELPLAEEELTALLRRNLIGQSEGEIKVKDIQISVTPGYLELFVKFDLQALQTEPIFIFKFSPRIKEGRLELVPEDLQLGELGLPTRLGSLLIEGFLKDKLNQFSQTIAQFGELKEVELADKNLIIKAEVLLLSKFETKDL